MKRVIGAVLALAILMGLGTATICAAGAVGDTDAAGTGGEAFSVRTDELAPWQTVESRPGSRFSTSSADWWAEAHTDVVLQDAYEMPDRGNTGYVSAPEDLVDFGTKYPQIARSGTTYNITDTTAAKYNYTFEGFFLSGAVINVNTTHEVLFRDFRMSIGRQGVGLRTPLASTQGQVYVLDAEMEGSTSALLYGFNITCIRCYLHDVYADHVKGYSGQRFVSCLFTEGGYNMGNPHPDCIQFSVDNSHGKGLSTDRVKIYGCRMDATQVANTVTNACIILKSEFGGGISNIDVRRNWFNGGNACLQLCPGMPMTYCRNVNFSDNLFGRGGAARLSIITGQNGYSFATANCEFVTGSTVGTVAWTSDGVRVWDSAALSGTSRKVTFYLTNYSDASSQGIARVTLCRADGTEKSRVEAPFGIDAFPSRETYLAIPGLVYEDLPTDEPVTVDFSALPAPGAGEFYALTVIAIQSDAADILRTAVCGTPAPYTVTLPEGLRRVERNTATATYRFLDLVTRANSGLNGAEKALYVSACNDYEAADEAVWGVIEAKAAVDGYLATFNHELGYTNRLLERAENWTAQSSPPWKAVLGRVFRTLWQWLAALLGGGDAA